MKKYVTTITALVLIGCQKPVQNQPVVASRHSHGNQDVKPADDSFIRPVERDQIQAGDEFSVEGRFRNPADIKAPQGFTTVKIIQKTADGTNLIHNEVSLMPLADDQDLKVRGEIKAPTRPGSYEIHLWYKGAKVAEQRITVKAKREDTD